MCVGWGHFMTKNYLVLVFWGAKIHRDMMIKTLVS